MFNINNKFSLIFATLLFFLYINQSLAQVDSSGLALSVPITDTSAVNGDIICSYPEGNNRCNGEYDLAILGIIAENTALELNDTELENPRPLLTSGIATVRVSGQTGNIEEGDFITTSANPGVGQKAVRNGYVVGVAIENYESADPNAVGQIQILMNIHPESKISGTRGNLIQFIRSGLAVPVLEPIEALRYLLAIAMILISFTFGMIYFGRASRAGIEAIGRNPLAKKVIQITVILNVVLTLAIIGVGLAIAYLILIL